MLHLLTSEQEMNRGSLFVGVSHPQGRAWRKAPVRLLTPPSAFTSTSPPRALPRHLCDVLPGAPLDPAPGPICPPAGDVAGPLGPLSFLPVALTDTLSPATWSPVTWPRLQASWLSDMWPCQDILSPQELPEVNKPAGTCSVSRECSGFQFSVKQGTWALPHPEMEKELSVFSSWPSAARTVYPGCTIDSPNVRPTKFICSSPNPQYFRM